MKPPEIMNINQLPLENLARDYFRSLTEEKELLEQQREYYKAELLKKNTDPSLIDSIIAEKIGRRSLGSSTNVLVEQFAKTCKLGKHSDWFFNQMLAKFAQIDLKFTKAAHSATVEDQDQTVQTATAEDQVDIKDLVVNKIKKDLQLTALWLIAKHPTRSLFLDKQTSIANRNYSSLVPLIMSAFKKFHGLPYSKWDPKLVHAIVDPNLSEVMNLNYKSVYTREQKIALRNFSLTPKSGKNLGAVKNPITTYALYPPADSDLYKLPMLARIIELQTWCAHPSIRTDQMILSCSDWDEVPEPLITADVLSEEEDWTV